MISRNSSYVSFLFFRRSLSSRRYVSASCLRSASSDDAFCIAAVDMHYTGLRHPPVAGREVLRGPQRTAGRLAGEGCVNALDRTETLGDDAPRETCDRRSNVCFRARRCLRSSPRAVASSPKQRAAACAEFAPISVWGTRLAGSDATNHLSLNRQEKTKERSSRQLEESCGDRFAKPTGAFRNRKTRRAPARPGRSREGSASARVSSRGTRGWTSRADAKQTTRQEMHTPTTTHTKNPRLVPDRRARVTPASRGRSSRAAPFLRDAPSRRVCRKPQTRRRRWRTGSSRNSKPRLGARGCSP